MVSINFIHSRNSIISDIISIFYISSKFVTLQTWYPLRKGRLPTSRQHQTLQQPFCFCSAFYNAPTIPLHPYHPHPHQRSLCVLPTRSSPNNIPLKRRCPSLRKYNHPLPLPNRSTTPQRYLLRLSVHLRTWLMSRLWSTIPFLSPPRRTQKTIRIYRIHTFRRQDFQFSFIVENVEKFKL